MQKTESVAIKYGNTEIFDMVIRDRERVIFYGNEPLRTKEGKEVCSPVERLIRYILLDLQLFPDGNSGQIRPFDLYEFQLDRLETGKDYFSIQFDSLASCDPYIRLKTQKGNKDKSLQAGEEVPEVDRINALFWSVSGILRRLDSFIEENIGGIEISAETEHPVLALFRSYYLQSSPEFRTAVSVLCFRHRGGVVLPVLLASGKISAGEYASAILTGDGCREMVSILSDDPEPVFHMFQAETENGAGFGDLYREACVIRDYLECAADSGNSSFALQEEIRKGESGSLEFKSTFRWDLRQNKPNPAVERASLKTICAFLNSEGGVLLIGVRDDGSTEGIESDKFANEDKFLLHLWTLIKTSFGKEVSPYVRTTLQKAGDGTVCIVECFPSPRPVFLRQTGFDEEFYIRMGPGSASLDISEALKYISTRFHGA
jgi:hypothetical protein